MPEIVLRLDGVELVLKRLESLGAIAREKAMVSAMKKALKPVVASAQNLAPRRSGALRLSIAAAQVRAAQARRARGSFFGFLSGRTNDTFAFVTVAPILKSRRAIALYNLSYRRHAKGIYYGHFIEFGTKKGVRPQRFLQRALEMNAQHVLDTFGREIGLAIDRQLRRK